MLALLGTLALAAPDHSQPSVTATVVAGVTSSEVAKAKARVKILSFVFEDITWDVACKGSAKPNCTVTSPGQNPGAVLSGTATTLVLRLGGQDMEVRAPSTPVPFSNVLCTNEN
jgi:hypothetical protein